MLSKLETRNKLVNLSINGSNSQPNGSYVANMHMQGHVFDYLVVIVGSRKVLFSHLGNNGHLEDFYLVGEKK